MLRMFLAVLLFLQRKAFALKLENYKPYRFVRSFCLFPLIKGLGWSKIIELNFITLF